MTRSGEFPSVRLAAADPVDAELNRLAPGIRKTRAATPKIVPQSPEHAEFLAGFGTLIRSGWTLRAIARHLGISHRYVIDIRDGNRPARTEACDWVARLWALLPRSVEPELPSSTGTGGWR